MRIATTFPLARALGAFVISLACTASVQACEPGTPRCTTLHRIGDRYRYLPLLFAAQQHCLDSIAQLDPDKDFNLHPQRYHGITRQSDRWVYVETAFDHYRDSVCGPDLFIYYIANKYLELWDKHLPGDQLDIVFSKDPQDKQRVLELSKQIQDEFNASFFPLVGAMANQALSVYSKQVEAIATSSDPASVVSTQCSGEQTSSVEHRESAQSNDSVVDTVFRVRGRTKALPARVD